MTGTVKGQHQTAADSVTRLTIFSYPFPGIAEKRRKPTAARVRISGYEFPNEDDVLAGYFAASVSQLYVQIHLHEKSVAPFSLEHKSLGVRNRNIFRRFLISLWNGINGY